LERYEQERSSAASVDVLRALSPVVGETKKAVAKTGDPALDHVAQLLDSNQPAQAQLRAALDYWNQALDIAPNERLASAGTDCKQSNQPPRAEPLPGDSRFAQIGKSRHPPSFQS
jgi:hypothetical protein